MKKNYRPVSRHFDFKRKIPIKDKIKINEDITLGKNIYDKMR